MGDSVPNGNQKYSGLIVARKRADYSCLTQERAFIQRIPDQGAGRVSLLSWLTTRPSVRAR